MIYSRLHYPARTTQAVTRELRATANQGRTPYFLPYVSPDHHRLTSNLTLAKRASPRFPASLFLSSPLCPLK